MSTLTISLIQPDTVWEDKKTNLRQLEQTILGLGSETELVVLPEMFSTGFSMNPPLLAETMEGETVTWMKRLAAAKKMALTGSVIIEEEGHYFNRMLWVLPNGQVGSYDKRHRFAYAGEDQHYTAGAKRVIASLKGWKIQLQVCYDLRFPVWSRQSPGVDTTGPEYDVLIYSANWPQRRILAWTTLLQARAIENQCYVVGVNRVGADGNGIEYNGASRIIDPMGEVLFEGGNQEAVFTLALDKTRLTEVRGKFPFWKDADSFVISQHELVQPTND